MVILTGQYFSAHYETHMSDGFADLPTPRHRLPSQPATLCGTQATNMALSILVMQ